MSSNTEDFYTHNEASCKSAEVDRHSRKRWQLNGFIAKKLASCFLAVVLAVGTAVPAFATTADADNTSASIEAPAPADDVASEPSAPAESGATTSPVPGGVVNETVALSPVSEQNAPETSQSDEAEEDAESSAEDEPEDLELCSWTQDGRTWSTIRGGSAMTVTDAQAFGVDVSQWQGTIDWARAKAAGVQFAIIRCGYGSAATGEMDTQFLANVQGCRENGIPMGIYLYAIASDAAEASAEGERVIDLLNFAGITPDELMYPVYYDMESENQKQADAETRGNMAENFCTIMQENGFTPGIYASHYWFDNILTDSRFDNWTKWAASYPSEGVEGASSSYSGSHDMWQCMSRGVVDGIEGRVDIDFDYRFVEAQYDAVYDYEYYLANNPDVAEVYGNDRYGAFLHFLETGMAEGRISSPTFNLHGYFNSNADLRAHFGLDFKKYYEHYVKVGAAEGRSVEDSRVPKGLVKGSQLRDLSDMYDPYAYLLNNPDLNEIYTVDAYGKTYIDDSGLFKHFLSTGLSEGRVAK